MHFCGCMRPSIELARTLPENLSVRSVVKSADRLIADQTTVGTRLASLSNSSGTAQSSDSQARSKFGLMRANEGPIVGGEFVVSGRDTAARPRSCQALARRNQRGGSACHPVYRFPARTRPATELEARALILAASVAVDFPQRMPKYCIIMLSFATFRRGLCHAANLIAGI